MRLTRVAATATALAIAAAVTTPGPANAASGVGTSATSTSLLDVALGNAGSLLGLRVLADDARATIDPSVATPEAFSRLNAATLTSSVLPAPLNNLTVPVLESRSPGGAGSVTGPALNLAAPLAGVPVPAALLAGSLAPATLTSAVDAAGARSTLSAALGNLSIAGGLVNVGSVTSALGADAKPDSATGSRTVKADAVSVLDLGALLDGLGVPLASLPIDAVSDILAGLGVPVPGVPTSMNLTDFVAELDDTVNQLQTQLTDTTQVVDTAAAAVLGALPVPTPVVVPTASSTVPQIQGVIDTVQGVLSTVLGQALSAIDNLTLLKVDGVEVGTVTKAADTVGNSTADIVAKVGSISLGGLNLGGVNLDSALATVNGVVGQVNSTLSSTLGAIDPGLANLVKVSMFDKLASTGVTSSAGYTNAIAGITALTASITPPANLTAIVTGLTSGAGIGSAITGAGGTVPGLSTVMGTFEGLLGNTVQALAGGATLKLASVTSGASFTTPVASTGGTLPRTGGTAQVAMFGFGLAVAALATRRWMVAHRAI